MVIANAQLHSIKPELSFCAGSNPACGMSEICDGNKTENKTKHFSLVNHTTQAIHHHHQFISAVNILIILINILNNF